MADKINNIHDKFVRESFSDMGRAAAFIEHFLPRNLVSSIDLTTLKLLKESYISSELAEYFSDLVFEIKVKDFQEENLDIVLLFEHKSTPDKNALIQVGHYMFSHWINCVRKRKKLKIIIPIIYYQGKMAWEVPDFSSIFKDYPLSIREFIPKIHHIFIALNSINENQIALMRDAMMAAAILAQKWRIDPVKLIDDFKRIFNLFPEDSQDLNFLEMIVVYALNVSEIKEDSLVLCQDKELN